LKKDSKIYVAGHGGLVGSAIVRVLKAEGFHRLITRTHAELDLEHQDSVLRFFEMENPDYVFLCAAKVGGIQANNIYRADFLLKNLNIQNNVITYAHRFSVKKLLFLGSSCIYPKLAPQPMRESYLLTGPLEPTNEPYAIAKIAGLKLCESFNRQYGTSFISVLPTNLYGPHDNFDLHNSHVLPALIKKFVTAKRENQPSVSIWGTGSPLREFLHVDDMASACFHLMKNYNGNDPVNIGIGKEISISQLANLIKRLVGYNGELTFDTSKPDGTPRKLLDVSKLKELGWEARIPLEEGIRSTIDWFLQAHSMENSKT